LSAASAGPRATRSPGSPTGACSRTGSSAPSPACRARPRGGGLALLYLDLDGFKPVNDRLGHAAGDEVLREVGRRLRALAREGDTVARVGGDEFVVLQEGGEQPAGAVRLAEAALRELARPVPLEGGGAASVGVSVGIALAPAHAAAPRDLARCADVALYAAKSAGRGTWRLFGGGGGGAEAPAAASAPGAVAEPLPVGA
jgi:diguanylate cyclase